MIRRRTIVIWATAALFFTIAPAVAFGNSNDTDFASGPTYHHHRGAVAAHHKSYRINPIELPHIPPHPMVTSIFTPEEG